MTKLVVNKATPVTDGTKTISMRMTTGDARIRMSVDGNAPVDIASTIKTADADFNIRVPDCEITAVVTGDATVSIGSAGL